MPEELIAIYAWTSKFWILVPKFFLADTPCQVVLPLLPKLPHIIPCPVLVIANVPPIERLPSIEVVLVVQPLTVEHSSISTSLLSAKLGLLTTGNCPISIFFLLAKFSSWTKWQSSSIPIVITPSVGTSPSLIAFILLVPSYILHSFL